MLVNLDSKIIKSVVQDQGKNELSLELDPLVEPDPVTFTFDSPGWYVVGGILFILICWALVRGIKRYRKNKYRREALRSLSELMVEVPNNAEHLLFEIRVLLKRVAIYKFGRTKVASLSGLEWLQFLENTGRKTPFTDCEILIHQDKDWIKDNIDELLPVAVALTKKWLKTHA